MALILPLALKFARPTFPPLDIAGAVYSVVVDPITDDNFIFGSFSLVQGSAVDQMAKLTNTNVLDNSFGRLPAVNEFGTIYGAASAYDFTTNQEVFFVPQTYLKKIKKGDSSLISTGSQSFVNGLATKVICDASGGTYVIGTYNKVGATGRNNISKWSQVPGLITTWHCSPPTGYSIFDLELTRTSVLHLYVAGNFPSIRGVARKAIARVRRDTGAVDTSFNASALYIQTINSLSVNSDDTVVVVGKSPALQLVCFLLSSTGALVTDYNSVIQSVFDAHPSYSNFFSSDITPSFVEIDPSGKIIVYALAVTHRGASITPLGYMIRISGGVLDTTFNSIGYIELTKSGIYPPAIKSIGINSINQLIVGGSFDTINGSSNPNYAVLSDAGVVIY